MELKQERIWNAFPDGNVQYGTQSQIKLYKLEIVPLFKDEDGLAWGVELEMAAPASSEPQKKIGDYFQEQFVAGEK